MNLFPSLVNLQVLSTEILPAAKILRNIVKEAEETIMSTSSKLMK